jgi:hypothetical protein
MGAGMKVQYRATRSAEWVTQQGGVAITLEVLASEAVLMLSYAAERSASPGEEDVEITYDALRGKTAVMVVGPLTSAPHPSSAASPSSWDCQRLGQFSHFLENVDQLGER